ncbi:MAG: hypothetical protein ICV83_14590 [Cytophagales bacterium]|nr:hypothetical protein [Cytophagales bacterium]
MRKPLLLLLCCVAAAGLLRPTRAAAQSFAHAGEYISFIGAQHHEITKDLMSYTSAVAHGKSARKIENRRKEMLQTVTDARRKIASLPPYQGDKSLRDSTARFLLAYYHILNDDYGKIVNLEEVAEQSYDAMEAYLLAQELAGAKIDEAGDRLDNTQKAFAATHKVTLVESSDEVSKKFAEATKVNEYHRVVYLLFFKTYKQEMYLIDAVDKKNINAVEQNKNTLHKYAEENIKKLAAIPAFNGDKSLVNVCRQIQEFYRGETAKIAVLTNFYLKEENFQKIKQAFEAKREKDRTQADVDQYNNALKEVNKAVNEFNSTSKQLFEARKQMIDSWNKASQQFLDKHVPKYKA